MTKRLRLIAAGTGTILALGTFLGLAAGASAAPTAPSPSVTDTYPAGPPGKSNPPGNKPTSVPPTQANGPGNGHGRALGLINNPHPRPGQTVAVSGAGFRPGEPVSVDIHSEVVHMAMATADSAGNATANVTIPSSFSGDHEITLTGMTSGNVVSVPLTVEGAAAAQDASQTLALDSSSGQAQAATTDGSLAYTGAAVAGLGTLAVVLVGGGAGLLFLGRRRHQATN